MSDEVLMLQHRFTEQVICVARASYLAGAHGRYRNWQMKGQGRFIAPPALDHDANPLEDRNNGNSLCHSCTGQ